jgi:hypothetical protein
MPRKVFTAGEVLAAADVNSFLMDQTVMSFADTAARGSAIPSPVTGMTTYLEDSRDLQVYDGSAYSSPFGMTLLSDTDFTTASSVAIDNVFTSEYHNYKIFIRIDSNNSSNQPTFLYRSSVPGDLATTTTSFSQYSGATFASNYAGDGSQLGPPMGSLATHGSSYELTLFNPNQTSIRKHFAGTFSVLTSTAGGQWVGGFVAGWNSTATAAAGFRFAVSAGTMSGNVKVYGMRNA